MNAETTPLQPMVEPVAPPIDSVPVATPVGTLGYATPAAYDMAIFRRGKKLMTPPEAELPEVCIKTGQTDDLVRLERRFAWVTPWWVFLIFVPYGLLILLVIYFAVRKKAKVAFSVQRRYVRRRQWTVAIGLVMLLSGITLFGIAITEPRWLTDLSKDAFALAGGVGALFFFLGAVVAGMINRLMYAVKIDKHHAHLRGAGEPFLSTLPPG